MVLLQRVQNAWNAIIGMDKQQQLVQYVRWNNVYQQLKDTTDYIRSAYQLNADVYAIMSSIGNKVAECPVILKQKKGKRTVEIYDHPLLDIINDSPNPNMSGAEFKFGMTIEQLATGNTYVFGLAPDSNPNKFRELYILPSNYTNPVTEGQMGLVKGYRMQLVPQEVIPAENVCHFRYFNPDFALNNPFVVGQAPLQAAARVITTSNSAAIAEDSAFCNGGTAGIVFEEDGMTEDQRQIFQENLDQRIRGAGNYKSIIASAQKVGYQKIGDTPVDLNLIESSLNSMRKLCNVFHVPSELFNDPVGSTYNNITEARKAFITDAVCPELSKIAKAFTKWLIPGWFGENSGYYFEFDTTVYPEMQADKLKLYQALKLADFLSLNEKREEAGFQTIAGNPLLDEPLIANGVTPASDFNVNLDEMNAAADAALKQLNISDYGNQK